MKSIWEFIKKKICFTGFVNKVGFNHIAVLVHRVFIASIPQPEDEEDWPGNNVKMGQEIKFTVNQVDFSSKLPYIRGVLYEEWVFFHRSRIFFFFILY